MRSALVIATVVLVACGGEDLQRGDIREVDGVQEEFPCPDDLEPIEATEECAGYSAAAAALTGEDGVQSCRVFEMGEFEGAVGCCVSYGSAYDGRPHGFFHVCSEAQ